MLASVGDPLVGTAIVVAGLVALAVAGARRRSAGVALDEGVTTEIKGAAALAVIFCHVGYFLIDDHRFLYPLSAAGGVAVDTFLLLSGFGLVSGALKRELKPLAFYRRRVIKLFTPLWLSLGIILALDWGRLGLRYPWSELGLVGAGIVPRADLYQNINSPLWYVTLTLFLYAVFPWLFRRARPWLSVAALALASYLWCSWAVPRLLPDVATLYAVHRFAFPLGALMAVVLASQTAQAAWARLRVRTWSAPWRTVASVMAAAAALYFLIHSGVGHGVNREEGISLLTVALVLTVGLLKPWRFAALAAFGAVSYEIYLLHWPLLARHDVLFRLWPSWAAMLSSLVILYAAGWALNRALKVAARR